MRAQFLSDFLPLSGKQTASRGVSWVSCSFGWGLLPRGFNCPVIPFSLEREKKGGTFVMGEKELGQKIERHMVCPCFKWCAVSTR